MAACALMCTQVEELPAWKQAFFKVLRSEADRVQFPVHKAATLKAQKRLEELDNKLTARKAVQELLVDCRDDPVFVFAQQSVQALLAEKQTAEQEHSKHAQAMTAAHAHLTAYHCEVMTKLAAMPLPAMK